MAEDKTLWIHHDQENDHYSSIENMQAYSRSTNTHRDHLFCAKCCGWVTKRKLHTHRCIYEFRCFDCGNHELNSSGDLMYHRNKKVHGTRSCVQCDKDMASGLCIQHHEQPDVSNVQSVVRVKHALDPSKKCIWIRLLVQSPSHA
ncbi:hypothetical protein EDD86DRAFT_220336 [Gorgonomyces haynaldii]|nr:hypothetical protein EDD86DRAFT_220336 [Gorgonomyces haynaldii]